MRMADEPQQPEAPNPVEIQQNMQAILDRAEAAAERAESVSKARDEASRVTAEGVREQYPGFTDAQVKQISDASANAVLAKLRKEFELAQNPPPAHEPEEPPAPPRKRTIADWVLGS
jgi:hypothetical protein